MRNSLPILTVSIVLAATPTRALRALEGIIVSEIHYHPSSECEEEEFIELYNRLAETVDLGGWRFLEGVPYSFPLGTSLGPHEYLVVARDPDALEARFGEIQHIHGPWGAWPEDDRQASLSNEGEDIVLADASGFEVNRVDYDDKTPWPIASDGEGPSLELVALDYPNDTPGNWRAADRLGSPWTYFQTSGKAYSGTLLIRLTEPGIWYLDDVSLRPEGGGANLLEAGGFETDGGWAFLGNHAGSARVTEGAHDGQYCLRIVASGPGDLANAVRQEPQGLVLGDARFTVSFWAKRVQSGPRLTVGLAGNPASFDLGEDIPERPKFGEGSSSFDAATGTYTVFGSSLNEFQGLDECYFLHTSLTGDGGLEALVRWVEGQSEWAIASLMIRETNAWDSKYASVGLIHEQGTWLYVRTTAGGSPARTAGPVTRGPVKLRLERRGDTFSAWAEVDGTLEEIGRAEIPMASTVLAGLAVTSGVPMLLSSAAFDGVSLNVLPLEAMTVAEDSPIAVATPGAPNTRRAVRVPPSIRDVEHAPRSITSESTVEVRAKVDCLDSTPVASVALEYQVVTPGHYVRLSDAAYHEDWTQVPMRDDGMQGDGEPDDGIWTARVPAQAHRTLVRYRIVATDAQGDVSRLPFADDPTPNFAWFVHDGISDYVANRKSHQGPTPYVHSAHSLSNLPVYHLLAGAADFQECVDSAMDGESREDWLGTFVAGGKAYDHIRYRPRGGAMRGVEKKSFKIKFNQGAPVERLDDFARPDPVRRSDLNLNSAFQLPGYELDPEDPHGEVGARGECGIFDTLAFSLFRWMGVPTPGVDWVQLRVVRSEEEEGTDQYSGDFFGLYMDVENPDARHLESQGLPEGNLYKIEGTWTKEANNCDPADDSDIRALTDVLPIEGFHEFPEPPIPDAEWLADNIDLDSYYSYSSVVEMIAHMDTGTHNYNLFHHPESRRWMMFPWDVHLTFTWSFPSQLGSSDCWSTAVLGTHETLRVDYENRLREGMDLLYTESKLFPIIDGWVDLIAPLAAADRDRWDDGNLASRYGPLDERVSELKSWIREHLPTLASSCADDTIPTTPGIASPATGATLPADSLDFASSAFGGSAGRTHAATRWIATRVTRSEGAVLPLEVLLAENELAPDWDTGTMTGNLLSASIPPAAVDATGGAVYRVRVRHLDDAGRWSHWSAPVEIEIVAAGSTPFIRGDSNGDGDINITDAITTLAHLFLGGASPACPKTEDTNDDGRLDLTDAVYLLRHLFLGGSPPLAPFPACGTDSTSDALPCAAYECP